MPEFQPWPKIPRLRRDITVTEKIDGTNAAIGVTDEGEVYAQSRTRIVTPEKDNFGFARWVNDNADQLRDVLGFGLHFGEWWGPGIQRGYGLALKSFALFNVDRWEDAAAGDPEWPSHLLSVVPVLYRGPWSQDAIDGCIARLREEGSVAAPGFMTPEGIVMYHHASRQMFKVLLENDDISKGEAAA